MKDPLLNEADLAIWSARRALEKQLMQEKTMTVSVTEGRVPREIKVRCLESALKLLKRASSLTVEAKTL